MQDMSVRHFSLTMLMVAGIGMYLVFSMNQTQETRDYNFKAINNAKNCIELQSYYSQAISFEKDFKDGGYSNEVTQKEQMKASQLGCKP